MRQDIHEDEITIDGALLRDVFKRQVRVWLWKGPLALAVLLALGLSLIPQSFTSTTSVSLMEPSPISSPLALLAGQSQSKKYLGVLKSREAAAEVEQRVHIQQMYGFATKEEALEFLMKHVTPKDNATDGLLYIDVTLPGPPRLDAAARRHQVKEAAALAANAYTDALRTYYITSDNERGSILLRGADVELRHARADFDDASGRLETFARSMRHVDPRSTPSLSMASPGGGASDPSATELGQLYGSLAQVEIQIRAEEAATGTQQKLVGGQLQDLADVPSEDPLLADARGRVLHDQTDLANLQVQFGPENPQVVVASKRLKIDQAALAAQVKGIQQNLTTEQVRSQALLHSLRARQAVLEDQIASAVGRLHTSRDLSIELNRLQTEVALRLEALKTVVSESAKVRLDNVSAQSRMTVIDDAIPARSGQPGTLALTVASLALVIIGFLTSVAIHYIKAAQRASSSSQKSDLELPKAVAQGSALQQSGPESDEIKSRVR